MSENKVSFPVDSYTNSLVLPGRADVPVKIYYGTDRWGPKEWIGPLYPKGIKESEFLPNYVQLFTGIQFNATQHQIYTPDVIAKWARIAEGRDFKFCPKVPQTITHQGNFDFEVYKDKLQLFFDGVNAFGQHLGPVYLQTSERYGPTKKERLFDFLSRLPKDKTYFLTLRNPGWFEDETYGQLISSLRKEKIGWAIEDNTHDLPKIDLTVSKAYIRYYVDNGDERLEGWVKKIRDWGSRGLTEAYLFISSEDPTKQLASVLKLKALVEKL